MNSIIDLIWNPEATNISIQPCDADDPVNGGGSPAPYDPNPRPPIALTWC